MAEIRPARPSVMTDLWFAAGSELKSQFFVASQAFSKTVPVEEQLWIMSIHELSQTIQVTQKTQTELHLRQSNTQYSAVTEQ